MWSDTLYYPREYHIPPPVPRENPTSVLLEFIFPWVRYRIWWYSPGRGEGIVPVKLQHQTLIPPGYGYSP